MTNDYKQVIRAIEDKFYEEQQLSDKTDIEEATDLSNSRVDSVIDDLDGGEIYPIYEKQSVATVYATKQMLNSITAHIGEPDWIEEYEFDEKRDLREEVWEANDRIKEYQKLERLLYGGGTPLEESVEYGLRKLGFDPDATANEEDFVIETDDRVFVVEVKGVSGRIKKKHVNQLGGWLDKKISDGVSSEKLTGLLIHNHKRYESPEDRDKPLTSTAEEFLKHRQSRHVSTTTLFNLIKAVKSEELDQSDAQEQFVQGDSNDG